MSTWVLLRGLARECRHWGRFPALLAEHMPGSQVILLDLPGNGRWNHLRSPLSVMAMAAQCRTELQARGMAPPYHLLAMSLGAMVAAAWATSAPHEVARMVLINTSIARSAASTSGFGQGTMGACWDWRSCRPTIEPARPACWR